jgi:hypothetical protein
MVVLQFPAWLASIIDGFQNENGTAEIRPVLDADGNYIIGLQFLTDSDW